MNGLTTRAVMVGLLLLLGGATAAAESTRWRICSASRMRSRGEDPDLGENVEIADSGKCRALSTLLRCSIRNVHRHTDEKRNAANSLISPTGRVSGGRGSTRTSPLSTAGSSPPPALEGQRGEEPLRLPGYREEFHFVHYFFFEFMKARKGLEIADSNVERLAKYREAARTDSQAGEMQKTTVLRAEGELSGALSDQIRARNA